MFTSPLPVNRTLENSTYAQTFPDTAVLVRQTPARAKKHKGDTDLGVTPLANITPAGGETPYTPKNILPKVTSTVTRPPNTASVSWPVNLDTHHGGLGEMGGKQVDQNFNMLTDQYGNPVEIQGLAPKVDTQQGEPLFTTDMQEPTSAQSLEFLRTNPYLQKLVEDRVAVLEARMRNELQQGNLTTRKKSGRYNVSETTCAPTHLRWPNESCLTGATRKRTSYDDLTLGQFVVGFLKNAMDTTNPQLSRAMLNELVETVKLSENLSWPIARRAFAVAMHRIEEDSVNWSDTRFLAENRLTFSQTAVFSGSVTMSPKVQPPQPLSSVKKIVCRWYNEGTCPHTQDHSDATGTTSFQHICMYCFKQLKRNNSHTELECNNNKKSVE